MLTSSVAHSAKNTDPRLLSPFDLVWDGCSIWVTSRGSSEVIQYSGCGERLGALSVPTPTGICIAKTDKHKCSKKRPRAIYVASSGGSVYTLGNMIATPGNVVPQYAPNVPQYIANVPQNNASMIPGAANMAQPPVNMMLPNMISPGMIQPPGMIPSHMLQAYISPGGMLAGLAWHKGKLYVAIHDAGYVGVYSGTTPVLSIKDDALVAVGYKPYGIKCLKGLLYITYTNMSTRQGAGYVNVYDPDCNGKMLRVISRSNLSIPYGLFMNDDEQLYVANSGSGYISVFSRKNEHHYQYLYNVRNSSEGDVVLDGIMGVTGKEKRYFVMSSDSGRIGALGVITL